MYLGAALRQVRVRKHLDRTAPFDGVLCVPSVSVFVCWPVSGEIACVISSK